MTDLTQQAALSDREFRKLLTPVAVAEQVRFADRQRELHRSALARLRAAETRYLEVELAHDAAIETFDAEIRHLTETFQKAREKAQAKIDRADLDWRSVQEEVRAALTAIRELPAWEKFDRWYELVQERFTRMFIDHREDANPGTVDVSELLRRGRDGALRARLDARRQRAVSAVMAFRAVVDSARMTYASEEEALSAARAALEAVKAEHGLAPPGWPQ